MDKTDDGEYAKATSLATTLSALAVAMTARDCADARQACEYLSKRTFEHGGRMIYEFADDSAVIIEGDDWWAEYESKATDHYLQAPSAASSSRS
ncbi:hypothetical protein ACSDGV_18205 [Pseudomonas aeruginosa]|uniref:hypothetical protein n=1 Tax=Pseudomonas aeruginosa TaxID=287 RepID=UPI00137294AA|nr:hypothetical protein [Pseudomonas aeruginosa]ELP1385967.1 hypothetical protein [Pseudomonas aeruginosa]MBW6174718.1 hypothetical protein [Pseudomonas aeruginosa]MBW6215045.1 hypothetical protein [Pseudomonas aeruginosa]MDG4741564.1 hypothetical protein [Pseudomonas aeruginosa]MZY61127.1 hypothetical protein [Pseudomonas aeruginosa]